MNGQVHFNCALKIGITKEGIGSRLLPLPVLQTATGSQAEQALIDGRKVCKGSRQIGTETLGKCLAEEEMGGSVCAGRTVSMLQLSLTRVIRLFN
jgi:hypothetical protein